ncbi:hypothetical protein BC629DRAFT_1725186 [Irpex lacteus]|nr:hypothetical protein BC629DRAFT_1725186 [Irpex lacteus]
MSQPASGKLPSRLGKVAGSTDSNPSSTSKIPRRSSKGPRLQALLNMPLDVFLETCTHLQPADLLNVARSSKVLRTMFMDRRSRYRSRKRFRSPAFPRRPAYASLAFEPFCHNCVEYHGDVYWRWSVRLCRPCFDKSTINVGWVDRWIGEDAAASLYKLREITRELGRSFELLPVVWVVGKRPALSKQARLHPRRETTQGSHGPSIAGRFVEALGGLG